MEVSNSKQLQRKIGVDSKVGTILWVRRKNGSWWPGRIVGPTELSPSHLLCPRPTGTPVKLLGRDYTTVNWYNLNTSRCIKAFRCGEFDDCIKKAESHRANPSRKDVKYARRSDAILHALELEKQELLQKLKRPGEELVGAIFRAKRTKRVYLPAESKNCLEPTFHEPLRVPSSPFGTDKCSFQCDAAEENPSSKSTESGSSEGDPQDPERDEGVTQLSDVRLQKCMLKRKVNGNRPIRHGDLNNGWRFLGLKNGTHKRGHSPISNTVSEDYFGTELNTRSGENLVSEANMLSQFTLTRDHLEKPGTECFDRIHVDHHNMMEPTLIDVDLTVQASYQGEHVPLISLMSGLSGKAIVGHPIEIELEASEHNSLPTLLQSTMLQAVWITSRRTPVCYVSHTNVSSVVKDEKNSQSCHNHDHLNVKGKENSFPETEELLMRKPPKKRCLSKPNGRTLTSFATEQKFSGNQLKQTEPMPTRVTCIPVKQIFSKLLVEVGGQQS